MTNLLRKLGNELLAHADLSISDYGHGRGELIRLMCEKIDNESLTVAGFCSLKFLRSIQPQTRRLISDTLHLGPKPLDTYLPIVKETIESIQVEILSTSTVVNEFVKRLWNEHPKITLKALQRAFPSFLHDQELYFEKKSLQKILREHIARLLLRFYTRETRHS